MSDVTELTLHERLAAVRKANERASTRSPEDARAILLARARTLARPAASADDNTPDDVDLLLFQVGDEQLSIPVICIVALARPGNIAPLPRAVPPVYGVTAWRGRPLTVLALASARPAMTAETRLLVLGVGSRATLALVVDAVDDVRRIRRSDLTPAQPGPRHRYALGVTSDGLLALDGNALMNPDSLAT